MKRCLITLCLVFFSIFALVGCGKTENTIRSLKVDESDVALLTIFVDDGRSESNFFAQNYGHAFISVENVSDESFVVGDMKDKS